MNHKAQWLESKHTHPREEKERDPTNSPEIQTDLLSPKRLTVQEEREGEERELLKEEELVVSVTSPRDDAAQGCEDNENAQTAIGEELSERARESPTDDATKQVDEREVKAL